MVCNKKGFDMTSKFTITLVRSRIKSRPYTKTDCKYLGPTWNNNIGLQSVEDTPEGLFHICQILSTKPDTCMVTGTSIRPEIIDTDRTLKNFEEKLIKYIVLDLDKYEYSTKNLTYTSAIKESDKFIQQYLPPEFHNVSYILRFSSSFLIGNKPYLRCHIIFLLKEPQYPREIGMWIKQDKIPVDATFYFNLTQPIFTAFSIWQDLIDPLTIQESTFPRLSLIKKDYSHVLPGWQPYVVLKHKDPLEVANLPAASHLLGKVGSFCRMIHPKKALLSLGYSDEGENRFLAPSSNTGIAGTILFENGYVYSHHDGDPLNIIVEKIHNFKRKSLNAYDIMYGWAILHKKTDPLLLKEFDFTLNQAMLNDANYQDEILQELIYRTEWIIESGYEGVNRKIIDGLLRDLHEMYLTELSREHIFNLITIKTKKNITKAVLKGMFKSIRRDKATQYDEFDPEANIRHMASIFKRQKILYSHHKIETGDFWCYFSTKRIWKRCNVSQTRAFVYNHIHTTIPIKLEIDYYKAEQLTRVIIRDSCLNIDEFIKGNGWAFKGGRYGILMNDLFSDSHQWQSNKAIKTLKKTDNIYKELPVTYKQWQRDKDKTPDKYIDFLESTCEEDLETVELIREYGGYILADSYYIHKMLIVEGVPGSGKSILAKIFQACVGSEYYSAISLNKISGQFGLSNLPGKKLAVMSEARGIDFKTLKSVIPTLLKIIGQDHVDTEAKRKDIMTELLGCKLVMMTNLTPVLPDDTGALTQRLIIIRFNKMFRGTSEEILGLDQHILKDGLASILNWHFKGLERLSKRAIFIEPKSGLAAKRTLEAQIDPLKTFIDKYFTIDVDAERDLFILQKDFTHFFRAYCKRLSQPSDKHVVQKRASKRRISSLYPKLKIIRSMREKKQQYTIYGLIAAPGLELEFMEEVNELLMEDGR